MKKYDLTIWQWVQVPYIYLMWLGMPNLERKESFHLVLKGMENHQCNFTKRKYFYNKFTGDNELWWECDHEGCNTVESDDFRNKTGFFAQKNDQTGNTSGANQ